MNAARTPWRRRIDEILADGEWHLVSELNDAAGPLVPPGRGAREIEYDRNRRSDAPVRLRPVDDVAAGQRAMVRTALRIARRRGAIEVDVGPPRRVRRIERAQ